MESRIAQELKMGLEPVAVIFTDDEPDEATRFEEGKWGCVIAMHTAATKGRTAAFDRKTHGCQGAWVGLGFGGWRRPGMAEFLSTGTAETEGEHYWKSPAEAKAFMDALPVAEIAETYVVFKPLSQVGPDERPHHVNFYATPDQLSALVVLTNYGRTTTDNIVIRMAAGCHSICLLPLHEAQRDPQRAVLGLFDISARPHVPANMLSFSVPYAMWQEMEANVPGSFLEMPDWKKVQARIEG